jgi:hypothetical protein
MRLHVVDTQERYSAREGETLRPVHPDQKRPDESRPRRDPDAGHVIPRQARLAQRRVGDVVESPKVRPGGDLGHDASECLVRVL